MRTINKIVVFLLKIVILKLFHFKGLSLCSIESLRSRCRITSEFAVIGKSQLKMGNIECASNTRLAAVAGGELYAADHCYFNRNCTVIARNKISIGKRCTFGPNVCVYDHDHAFGKNGQTGQFKLGSITIGENCWIGANAIILRDTVIGKNCVIAAGCVVKGHIPDNSIVHMKRELTVEPLHD